MAMKIHISETTYRELKPYPYIVQERGTITVKGKGTMKTYWLLAKNQEGKPICPFSSVIMDELAKADHIPDGSEHLANVERSDSVEIRNVYSPVSFADVARNKSSTTSPGSSPLKANFYKQNINHIDQYQKPDPNYMKIIEIKSPTKEKQHIADRMKYSNEKHNNFENRGRNPISNNDYSDDVDPYRSQTCILL
ncbi:hypothetical protein KUTeg_023829 [Tegillarca granosa]|uniref:Guanylate cyclase domain-containing protein n=1 Tax=Tegillarca granosa TaxID=220873 RepID=A0ABQ9E365_TEGGR|nr:hypothetical protein KUTeg_023829 [Tegillarca granosa]